MDRPHQKKKLIWAGYPLSKKNMYNIKHIFLGKYCFFGLGVVGGNKIFYPTYIYSCIRP